MNHHSETIKIPISKIDPDELKIVKEIFKFTVKRNGIDYLLTPSDDSDQSRGMVSMLKNRYIKS